MGNYQRFSDYLIDNTFVVFTDKNPLICVLQKAKLDAMCQQYIFALGSYNFTSRYKSGKI